MAHATESDDALVVGFSVLPESCIAHMIPLTSPRDACSLACMSRTFRSVAESDIVWERFLPSDYRNFVSQVPLDEQLSLLGLSKRQLFFRLCENPLLIDRGQKSFWLDKKSGKKCFMLSAWSLFFSWGPPYWRRIPDPDARFADVAELNRVCWFDMKGWINSSMLSQNTVYEVYLVLKKTLNFVGFKGLPVNTEVIIGSKTCSRGIVQFDDVPAGQENFEDRQRPRERADNWKEVKVGEFYTNEESRDVEMSIMQVELLHWKRGIAVQGIEIRPKEVE